MLFKSKKKQTLTLASPTDGKYLPIEDVSDVVFSEKILGDGVAIEPTSTTILSPINGSVENIFDTKHAIGLKSDEGFLILIHIGIDTVKLKGKYFNTLVSVGDKVIKGQPLIDFDLDKIKEEGYLTTTPIVITNENDNLKIEVLTKTPKANEDFIRISKWQKTLKPN